MITPKITNILTTAARTVWPNPSSVTYGLCDLSKVAQPL